MSTDKITRAVKQYDVEQLNAKNKLFGKLNRMIRHSNRVITVCHKVDKALRESLVINSNEREEADRIITLVNQVKGEV